MRAAPNPACTQTRSAGATLRLMATIVIIAQKTAGTTTTTSQLDPPRDTASVVLRLARPGISTMSPGEKEGGVGALELKLKGVKRPDPFGMNHRI